MIRLSCFFAYFLNCCDVNVTSETSVILIALELIIVTRECHIECLFYFTRLNWFKKRTNGWRLCNICIFSFLYKLYKKEKIYHLVPGFSWDKINVFLYFFFFVCFIQKRKKFGAHICGVMFGLYCQLVFASLIICFNLIKYLFTLQTEYLRNWWKPCAVDLETTIFNYLETIFFQSTSTHKKNSFSTVSKMTYKSKCIFFILNFFLWPWSFAACWFNI